MIEVGVMRTIVLAALVLTLAACQQVRTESTKFNQLPSDVASRHFILLPYDGQRGSLEYRMYAESISKRLKNLGLSEVKDIELADYAVFFDYGVGQTRQITGSVPIYGQTGGGMTSHSGTISTFGSGGGTFGSYAGQSYSPLTFGVVGMSSYTRRETDRYFELSMVDLAQSSEDNIINAFEGVVTSSGTSTQFLPVSECLFDSLFDDFYASGSRKKSYTMADCGK